MSSLQENGGIASKLQALNALTEGRLCRAVAGLPPGSQLQILNSLHIIILQGDNTSTHLIRGEEAL